MTITDEDILTITRRSALTVLALAPIVLRTEPALTAEPTIDCLAHTLVFRRTADSEETLFDDGAVTTIGTEYESFHEVWEVRGGEHVRRVSQAPASKHRIVGRDEKHSWTFSDYNNIDRFACDDPNAIHLQDLA